ncbi:RDD family protein [Haloprofundus halophilus]|uniref:RDD family protein n=1 Tax=Haloprofundus halophilus TaxID=2283527 RepID=UPI000E42EC9B|nr:RDD family protein [Haloprofundus halophilus]
MKRPIAQLGTQKKTFGPRLEAFVIDVVLLAVIAGAFAGVGAAISMDILVLVMVGALLLPPFYFVYMEAAYGQTYGKKYSNIVVVNKDGSDVGFVGSFVRNLLRVVDSLPFFYLLGIALIYFTDDAQRVGDMLAKTVVVETE